MKHFQQSSYLYTKIKTNQTDVTKIFYEIAVTCVDNFHGRKNKMFMFHIWQGIICDIEMSKREDEDKVRT